MTEMKTLTIGEETYEIVDDKSRNQIGNIEELETSDKTSLVAAINEAIKSGGGGNVDSSTVERIVEEYLAVNPPQDGKDGDDGISPTVTVDKITGGHRVTITDAKNTTSFDVLNGDDASVDVANFATKDDVKAKADDVLFTDDYRAGTDFGAFKAGDSLQNLTMREIVTRLLNATEKKDVIQEILSNEIPMLSGSSDGLEPTTFSVITLASDQASAAPAASGFYQITNDGVVTEQGYQLFTESTGRSNYAIAIPEGTTIKRVYMWDDLTQSWLDYSPVFTKTGTTTVDGHSYVTYESDDSSSGEVLRFEIEQEN